MHAQAQLYPALITLVVLALIVRRTLRTQTVRVWALIAVPALLLIAAGALAGAGLGYARGRHSTVTRGPSPGTLVVQGSPLLATILVAAFGLRFIARMTLGTTGPLGLALSDAFVVFAAASVAVARGMLFFAWRRLSAMGTGIARVS